MKADPCANPACEHTRGEHFHNEANCTYSRCECKRFRDASDPAERPDRPSHPSWCRCYGCKQAMGAA